jgi:site-specific recombinase XerD
MIPKMYANGPRPVAPAGESRNRGSMISPELPDERETTAVANRGRRRSKQLDAGPFAADVASFRLHLAAENKAAGTIRIYTEAPLWFAAAHLLRETDKTRWEQVGTQDVQRWIAWLLGRYSGAYARQQYRSLRQFFGWLAAEDEVPDPMAGLRAPAVRDTPVPVFTSGELSRLEQACRGGTFTQRRDAAILAVFRATGIRLAELAGIRYDPGDPGRSDLDLDRREIRVRGKGGRDRAVRIDHEAARRLDRYLRVRARHEQAHRLGLWLGTGGRGPLTGNGIYQIVRRRGDQAGVRVSPHRFRHHFSHTWLDRGGAEGDLMELNGWSSPQMLRWYGGSVRGARARRHYDLIMRD